MQRFDDLNSSLLGRKLIEASAGTGKTQAISSLYLRLLLERRLTVGQILVVTFTEAATDDLKRRIRQRIHEAATAFATGEGKDRFLSGLMQKIADWKEAQAILENALRMLDEASIFTIHGFCQRVLQENAFESSSLFEGQFTTSQEKLLREIVDDFWRSKIYPASRLLIEYAWQQKFLPDALWKFASTGLSSPFLEIIPEIRQPDAGGLLEAESKLLKAYERLGEAWATSKAQIREYLLNSNRLKRNLYRKPALETALQAMDRYLASDSPLALPKDFDKFLPTNLTQALKSGYPSLEHSFFGRCEVLHESHEALVAMFAETLLALRVELAGFVRQELRRRKKQQNLRFFDDLLLDLYEALQGREGDRLTKTLQDRYPAALIDEFQDTDPIQYAILSSIYSSGDELSLFLIGDPKQAIYSFRGADIFAYLEAARGIEEQTTLTENWRSSERLVEAVNAFFLRARNPFVFPEISFKPVRAARVEAPQEFLWKGSPDPAPLKLWFLERPANHEGRLFSKASAEAVLPPTAASDIVELLQASDERVASVQGRPVSPGDIAVLVRTNREARLMQDALRQVRVPCVLYSDQSVFASHEAIEVERILAAIAEPSHAGKVRAALSTDILGVNGNELFGLASEDVAWDKQLQTFAHDRDVWIGEGLMSMATRLMTRERVRGRLLEFPDGERRLTNLLHCFELLHQAAVENSLGIDGLLKWLAEARCETEGIPEEQRQMRLETDEQAVKVVTVHKSKGLQYPIVYCPFSWNTSGNSGEVATFHDERQVMRTVKDLGSPAFAENQQRARQEALAENVRLLYVALTRAKYRCTVVWGAFSDAGASAMAYLLHRPATLDSNELVEQMEAHFKSLDDDAIHLQLEALAQEAGKAVALSSVPPSSAEVYIPPVPETESLTCRKLSRSIPQDWGISSFTSLVSGRAQAAELPDRDPMWASAEPTEMARATSKKTVTFFDFPRGTRAGTVLHEIFEVLDFSLDQPQERRMLVREKLLEFGFDAFWQEAVSQMVHKVLATPLQKDKPDFTLSRLQKQHRLHEMEFSFPLDPLTPRRLRSAFAIHRKTEVPNNFAEMLERLSFSRVRGTMKGFVDLVFQFQGRFYLLDWKSNSLGDHFEAYRQQALQAAMEKELYVLQYHLYSVALHRHLSFRLPQYHYATHFGGVFYLFLRGIDPQQGPEFGIYYDLPSEALIQDLSKCLHSER